MGRRQLRILILGYLLSSIGCGGAGERLPISDRSKSNKDQSQSKLIGSKDLTTSCTDQTDESADVKSSTPSQAKEILDLNALVNRLSSSNGDLLGRSYISSLQIFNAQEFEQGRYVDVKDPRLMRKLIETNGFQFLEDRMENLSKLLLSFKVSEDCKTIQSTSEASQNTYSIDLETSNGRILNFLGGKIFRTSIRLVSDSAVELSEEFPVNMADACDQDQSVVLKIVRVIEFAEGAPETVLLRREIYDTLQLMTLHPSLITSAAELPNRQSRNPNTVSFNIGVLRLFDDSLSSAHNGASNPFEIQKVSCETEDND